MSEVKKIYTEPQDGESPYAELSFERDGVEAKLKLTVDLTGDWKGMFDDIDPSEDEARAGFVAEFFERVVQLF